MWEQHSVFTQVAAPWCLSSWGGAAPHTPAAHVHATPAYQRCNGLVGHVVAGGCVVLDHLPLLHVQPPANAVDLPGGRGMLQAAVASAAGALSTPASMCAQTQAWAGACQSL